MYKVLRHLRKQKAKYGVFAVFLVCLVLAMRIAADRISFDDPYSTVVFDRHNNMLGARIASDGQWRFPEIKAIPEKYQTCLLLFEDQHFLQHPGFNPLSLMRAFYQNVSSGEIRSGGSTLTMQTVRLSRKGKSRTIKEKIIEIFFALGLELKYDKNEILFKYASHAPFGGNVVGLDAASWRYFGRPANNLSWAESATLAVLPNSPALIHPGRNRQALHQKRNKLLQKLFEEGKIDTITLELSLAEPLPLKPLPLPETAFHITSNAEMTSRGAIVNTTIDAALQEKCNNIVARHIKILGSNNIHNASVIIADNRSGEVLVYIGNHYIPGITNFGGQVDVATKPRSGGSILKPFLYAAMLEAGEILPGTLVADVPTTVSGYSPRNFNMTYDGAVRADEALIRSLNVPAVRMFRAYGIERFYTKLIAAGVTTLTFPSEHYGLSLILGGCEVTLWDMVKIYSGMAFQLENSKNETVVNGDLPYPEIFWDKKLQPFRNVQSSVFDAGAIYLMFDAMTKVKRPEAETGWETFSGSASIAWKTGTSFGFRDAYAIGVTPGYTIGVWVGNADGEGRPGLTGIQAAAPIVFETFDILPHSGNFGIPYDKLEAVTVCLQSGKRPSPVCQQTTNILAPRSGLESEMCTWHNILHLDSSERHRVHADCYPQHLIRQKSWFSLPPAMAWYYRHKNPFYKPLPPWKSGCTHLSENPMQLIWPENPNSIYIPILADGNRGKVIFDIAHRHPEKTVFWYIDNQFMGQTSFQHKMSLQPEPGTYKLVLVDEDGNFLTTSFTIAKRN